MPPPAGGNRVSPCRGKEEHQKQARCTPEASDLGSGGALGKKLAGSASCITEGGKEDTVTLQWKPLSAGPEPSSLPPCDCEQLTGGSVYT